MFGWEAGGRGPTSIPPLPRRTRARPAADMSRTLTETNGSAAAGGSFYGRESFRPWKIVTQIATIQLFFYITFVSSCEISSTPFLLPRSFPSSVD